MFLVCLFVFLIMELISHDYQCPYCWQTITAHIDSSVKTQQYIEDCSICCRPIQITVTIERGEVGNFDAVGTDF